MEPRLSYIRSIRDYLDRILEDQKEMKCLILDAETVSIVSLVISQTEILQKDVFLVETIEKSILVPGSERLSHLAGVYFIRPTESNISLLQRALEYPKYGSYSIYFTNTISIQLLKELASADRLDLIKHVVEVFSDFYPLNHDLFSLNIPSVMNLTNKPKARWSKNDEACIERITQGLFSSLLSLKKFPVIRYQRNSDICAQIAEKVHTRLREDPDLMLSYGIKSGLGHKSTIDNVDQSSVLLIIDRREDPVTPLLHQWTYQAMLHELLTIDLNKVSLKQLSTAADREIPLSCTQDEFYQQYMFSNFGDLAEGTREYVSEYERQQKKNSNMESIDDMKRFLEIYPEFSKMAGNVSKHVTLTSELDNRIRSRVLLDVSELEQDIACNENKNEQAKRISEILRDPRYNSMDKLKLVILFALRYENDDRISVFRDSLRACGVREEQIRLIDEIISYAGAQVRSCDLFHNKNMISRAKYHFTTVMKNVPNVFTQHQSHLSVLIEQLTKQKLKESDFPATMPFNSKEPLTVLIVFIIGGATYEEAKEIGIINRRRGEITILLGGNCIHNSVSFLAELLQISMDRP
jgi:vacuolar protein sorting-associated protein 45